MVVVHVVDILVSHCDKPTISSNASEKKMWVNVAEIIEETISDGRGLRYAIYFQGCTHRCTNCHNPHTHDHGAGTDRDVDVLCREFGRNPLLKGITLSGGEPLEQPEAAGELARRARELGLDVWLYTGYKFEDIPRHLRNMVLSHVNVMVDGRFDLNLKSPMLAFRGSSNQRLIDVARTLDLGKIVTLN